MNTVYVTYMKSGVPFKGVISSSQYHRYSIDPSIRDLQIHADNRMMESAFNAAKGIYTPTKNILLG